MKKRILSIMLASILAFPLSISVFAEESRDSADRLASVTEKVKAALALDTEQYTQFDGQLTEGELAPSWRLSWSGEGGSLEITATESGKILNYYRYDDDESWDTEPLSLPKGDPAKAKDAAAAFLNQVLDSAETVDPADLSGQANSLRQIRYYFRGTILLNGQPSPLNYSVAVRASDYAVVQFYRDGPEAGYIGDIPAAKFAMKQSAAAPLLRDTLSLRLEYVLDGGETTAVLRYLPNSIHNFYVDDVSKKLVDLTELYEELGKYSAANGVAEDSAAEAASPTAGENGSGLTQAEQLGADKLKGTLDKDALDKKAKAVSQLGLGKYTLASVSYREEELTKDELVITAQLTYARQTEDGILRRWVTLNAKTGELIGVSSTRMWDDDTPQKVDEAAARKTAETFLTAQQKERFAQCGAYTGDSVSTQNNGRYGVWSFQYARKANGYFFPADRFTIEIDAADGSVCTYSQSWTQDVKFDSPDGIVSADKALDAYFGAFEVIGGYVSVPQKIDLSNPDYAPLAEMGYRALNSLKLGWTLKAPETRVTGIDAKTGKPVAAAGRDDSGAVEYGDLDGSWAKAAAETLADYGIGYAGGKFRPDKKLTQLDLVALLASTQGVLIDPDNPSDGDADWAYRVVYGMGALQRDERDDSRVMTRIDVIKLMLDVTGYGPAAKLQGIYRTDFPDQAEIPDGLLGYAALAQGLHVVQGDSAGRLNPTQSATRGQAAVMLLALMQRD